MTTIKTIAETAWHHDGDFEFITQLVDDIIQHTNADFIKLKGGKRAFRRLPELLKKGAFCSDEYHAYKSFLELEAKRLGCNINEMDINDEDVPYEKIKW